MAYDETRDRMGIPHHEPTGFRTTERFSEDGHPSAIRDQRSLGDLFSELTVETRTLIRHEIELARIEMADRAKVAGKNASFIGIGGAVAYVGFAILMFAVAFLLAEVMPLWLSSLIVGAIVAGVGYALIQKGIKTLKDTNFALERTNRTLKEDKQWMKEEMR